MMETTRFVVNTSSSLETGKKGGGGGGHSTELELSEMTTKTPTQRSISSSVEPPTVIAIQPSPLFSFNRPPSRRRFTLGSLGLGLSVLESPSEFPDDEDYCYSDVPLTPADQLLYHHRTNNNNKWSVIRPTKTEILQYFAGADSFCVNRINQELQITDDDGFPLFDSWVDVDLCNKVWRLEAYGRIVLNMQEPMRWCGEFATRSRPRLTMYDWNGDFFGALVPSDPFLIISGERRVVAKIVAHRTPITGPDEATPVVIDGPVPNNAATANNNNASSSVPTKPCWLCVLEQSGKHVARLEDFQTIFFNRDVQFQVKLLALAAFVRLIIGQINHPIGDLFNVFKYAFTCCGSSYY